MKKGAKVKVLIKDKYVEGVIKEIVDAKGFKGSYQYKKVYVTLSDGEVRECRDYDLIIIQDDKLDKKK